nr:CHAT domain-containing protein [uncultured Psychroserpens sp.]
MKQFYNCYKLTISIILVLVSQYDSHSQPGIEYSRERIQNLIDVDSIEKAELELRTQTEYYIQAKQYDSLSNLIYFHGKISNLKGDSDFITKSEIALEQLKTMTKNPEALYNAYSDMASLTVDNGLNQLSYDYNLLGLKEAEKTSVDRLNKMAKRTYGLSSTSYFMRKFDAVKKHGIQAFKINQKNPEATAANVYSACNILGLMMQSENKLDSALYYYNNGVNALKTSTGNTIDERYYFPAVLSGNMAIIYMNQGQLNKSLKTQQEAIYNYKIVIDSSQNNSNLNGIKYNYLSVINDMGSNYVKLGQVERALQLFEHNYNKAKDYFPENSIQQIIFTNQYAQGKWVANDHEEALKLIDEAELKFKSISKDYAGYMTFSMAAKANILENFDRKEDAHDAYKYCDELYDIVNPGNYSHDRLTTLREATLFYSRNGYKDDAEQNANRIITIVKETSTEDDLEMIKAYNLMSEVLYNLKNYSESLNWSNKTITIINKNKALKSADSIFWKELKTHPILIKNKANYKLIDTTNVNSLSKIHNSIKKLIDIHNTSTSKYSSNVDKSKYLESTRPLFEFAMQISLKLYELTNDKSFLDYVISIHESTIYNRIRSKIGLRDNMKFNDVPKEILEKETVLKDSLATLRSQIDVDEKSIQNFMSKNEEWNSFLEDLKQDYPKYYKMRYEIIKQSLGNIKDNIPLNTTVVRYFFIADHLYAFSANSKSNTLYKLDSKNLVNQINLLSTASYNSQNKKPFQTLYQLYKQLWQPLENDISTEKIIIIPDRELFNLSFESLTFKSISDLKELTNSCLLSKHIISYNYSLYLLDKNRKTVDYNKDFIVFAPGFNDEMKEQYKVNISDSLSVDKTYLTLLPQPFTEDLAKASSKLFDGNSFINENASKQIFTQQAKEHKIIHIGTHAESNNVSPELSRLIFAKNMNDTISSEDNSLYTYEIYNQNLSSNLAILTACETGKPTYQAGEGMISLAHAFNYAGSESILTSLWKIDEQSSTKIIENFYGYLKKGLTKDEALQKAKLDYITSANGRTLAPEYWAGLVLIGDTAPINLKTTSNTLIFWILGVIILLFLLWLIFKNKRKK